VVSGRRAARPRTDHDHVGLVGNGLDCSYVLVHGVTSVSCGLVKQFTSLPRSESKTAIEALRG
jgi:hypothetical protein